MRQIAILGALFVASAVLADEAKKDAPAIKEITIKLEGQPRGKVTEPTVLTTVDELKKAIDAADSRKEVLKHADFGKEKVLIFAWAGSGRDMLAPTVEKGEYLFTYKAGLTRDLRSHVKVFVLPKDAKFKVVTGR